MQIVTKTSSHVSREILMSQIIPRGRSSRSVWQNEADIITNQNLVNKNSPRESCYLITAKHFLCFIFFFFPTGKSS